mmetsp:Transcript_11103/g.17218  ORF Transcript_11103/g.17218 Transcript_11103/m.17218 type:complete len:391 (+) Transcript_11103:498-1670(+)
MGDQSTPSSGLDPGLAAALGRSAEALTAGAEAFARAASGGGVQRGGGVYVRSVTRFFKVQGLPNGLPTDYDSSHVGALRNASTIFARTYGVAYLLDKDAAGAYPDARPSDVDICAHLLGGLLELSTNATNWTSKLRTLESPGELLDALELTVSHRVPGDIERFQQELKELRVGSPQLPNSNALYDKYTRLIQSIKNAQALQHSPVPLAAAAVLALERRDDHEFVRLYLAALKKHPSYMVQAADMLAGDKFAAGTLTLEDASQRVSMVEVQTSAAADGQAFAADAAELARFRLQWGRAPEEQRGGRSRVEDRRPFNSDGKGLCYNCGSDSHHIQRCHDPTSMNRHALIASLRERGVEDLPTYLRQFDPPPAGCQCGFCSSKPVAPAADRRA